MSTCPSFDEVSFHELADDDLPVRCRGRPGCPVAKVLVRADRPRDHMELFGGDVSDHGRGELQARDAVKSQGFVTVNSFLICTSNARRHAPTNHVSPPLLLRHFINLTYLLSIQFSLSCLVESSWIVALITQR